MCTKNKLPGYLEIICNLSKILKIVEQIIFKYMWHYDCGLIYDILFRGPEFYTLYWGKMLQTSSWWICLSRPRFATYNPQKFWSAEKSRWTCLFAHNDFYDAFRLYKVQKITYRYQILLYIFSVLIKATLFFNFFVTLIFISNIHALQKSNSLFDNIQCCTIS